MPLDYKKEFEDLIETVTKESASDLHLSSGRYPTIRVGGFLIPLMNRRVLTKEDTLGFAAAVLTPADHEVFLKTKEIDFSYDHHQGQARFRGNGFFQQGSVSFAFRLIPKKIRTFAELNLPPVLETFIEKVRPPRPCRSGRARSSC